MGGVCERLMYSSYIIDYYRDYTLPESSKECVVESSEHEERGQQSEGGKFRQARAPSEFAHSFPSQICSA